MTDNETILDAGEAMLKAYVAVKSGNRSLGAKLFVAAVEYQEEGTDYIADGIGNAMNSIEAEDDDDLLDDDDDLLDDDMESEFDDDDDDLLDDDETEVPASVASFLEID